MRNGDEIDFNADVQRHDTKPNRFVRVFQFGTATQTGWSAGGLRRYWRFSEHASATRHTVVRVTAGITRHVGSRRDVRATLHSSFIERSNIVDPLPVARCVHAEFHCDKDTPSGSRRVVACSTTVSCRRRAVRSSACTVRRLIGAGDLLDATRTAGDNVLVAKVSWLFGVRRRYAAVSSCSRRA
jgi:hypothetical protein